MTPIQFSKQLLARLMVPNRAIVEPLPDVPPARSSPGQDLGCLGQVLLVGLLLLRGSALPLTLWLLPVALPVALLGMALRAAPNNPN
jgi:hypothetical protein